MRMCKNPELEKNCIRQKVEELSIDKHSGHNNTGELRAMQDKVLHPVEKDGSHLLDLYERRVPCSSERMKNAFDVTRASHIAVGENYPIGT